MVHGAFLEERGEKKRKPSNYQKDWFGQIYVQIK